MEAGMPHGGNLRERHRLTLRRWFFSMHALLRMQEMAAPRAEVLAVLAEPEVTYPSSSGRVIRRASRIEVCTDDEIVVTVLFVPTRRTNARPDSKARLLMSISPCRPSRPSVDTQPAAPGGRPQGSTPLL